MMVRSKFSLIGTGLRFVLCIIMILTLASCNENIVTNISTYSDQISNSNVSASPRVESEYGDDFVWTFRCLGTMNITRDRVSSVSISDISGDFTEVIRKSVEYAVDLGANYIELAIMPYQKQDINELYQYYKVLPGIAREAGLNVYFRAEPSLEQIQEMLYSDGEDFEDACERYFSVLEKLWLEIDPDLLRDGDIVSTFAEGDNRMTTPLGMVEGTIKYREYLALASDFIDHVRERSGKSILFTESVCGGESRLTMFTKELASRLDFISWDHYAGIGWLRETEERMRSEARQTARWIEEYAIKLDTRIALGEWCTHWDKPKSKETQAVYVKIMTDALDQLPSRYFPGMMYFHFSMPHVHIDYENATHYLASPLLDKSGTFPAYDVIREAYHRHSE